MGDIAANFFELWGAAYMGQFSQYMYKAELYEGPFLWLVALPLAALFVYYRLWDNVRFAKTWVWATLVAALSAIVALIGYSTAYNGLYDYMSDAHVPGNLIDDADYMYFAAICFAWTAAYSVVLSLVMKSISVKCRYVPF